MAKEKGAGKYFGVSLTEITRREDSVVPNIICKLTTYLLKNGVEQEGIFRINGSMKTVEKLMNHFDKKGDTDLIGISDPASVASLLKHYLRDLPDTLVPASMTQLFVAAQEVSVKDAKSVTPRLRHLVSTLPTENFLTLKYLCAFLVLASKQQSSSKMNPSALSTVFGPNIFKCGPGFAGLKEQGVTNCIVLQFINKYEEIFIISEGEPTPNQANFTMDKLKEELKKQKLTYKPSPTTTLVAKADGPPAIAMTATMPKPSTAVVIDSLEFTSKMGKTSTKDFPLREKPREAGDGAGDRRMDKQIDSLSFMTGLADGKNKNSLEEEFVALSDTVISEIDKAIRKFVFGEAYSEDEDDDDDDDISEEDADSIRSKDTLPRDVSNFRVSKTTATSKLLPTNKNKNNSLSPNQIVAKEVNNRNKNNISFDDDDSSSSVTDDDDGDDSDEAKQHPIRNRGPIQKNGYSGRKFFPEEFSTTGSERMKIVYDDSPEQPNSAHLAKKSTNGAVASNVASSQLTKDANDSRTKIKKLNSKIKALQQKLKSCEDDFERKHNRKMSNDELTNLPILKSLKRDIHRCKMKLEELTVDQNDKDVNDYRNHHHHHPQDPTSHQPSSVKEIFESLVENLHEKRLLARRPEDPKMMSPNQLAEEKTCLQKALLKFEQLHGRPSTSTAKGTMLPLYDRYRIVKRLLKRAEVIETETTSHRSQTLKRNKDSASSVTTLSSDKHHNHHHQQQQRPNSSNSNDSNDNSNLNQMTLSQLVAELEQTRQTKRNVQTSLQKFEQRFEEEHGRKVQKADQMLRELEYRQYNKIKSKLKLLEILITKRQKQSPTDVLR